MSIASVATFHKINVCPFSLCVHEHAKSILKRGENEAMRKQISNKIITNMSRLYLSSSLVEKFNVQSIFRPPRTHRNGRESTFCRRAREAIERMSDGGGRIESYELNM
jgi:hypothetical protein